MNKIDFDSIELFKQSVLQNVWTIFLDDRRADVQNPVGMWRWAGDCVQFVDGIDGVTLKKGSLSFKVLINNCPILFSVWLQMGEIRIGYLIPVELMPKNKPTIEQRLASVYNGQPCQRIVKEVDRDAVLFDHIFKDDFADFYFMEKAYSHFEVNDMLSATVIADRIHDILVHVFIAVLNELISSNGFAVRPGFVGTTRYFNCEINGVLPDFIQWAKKNKIIINNDDIHQIGVNMYAFRCDVPSYLEIENVKERTWSITKAVPVQSIIK